MASTAADWFGYFNGTNSDFVFTINTSGVLVTFLEPLSGILDRCEITALLTPVLNENLYTVTDVELSSCTNTNLNGTGYSGLATVLSPANEPMIFIFYNDSFSGISEMYLD